MCASAISFCSPSLTPVMVTSFMSKAPSPFSQANQEPTSMYRIKRIYNHLIILHNCNNAADQNHILQMIDMRRATRDRSPGVLVRHQTSQAPS